MPELAERDRKATQDRAPRVRCYRCWRPAALCFCADLPRIDTRTAIVVLQHPHERTHPFGTARLCTLSLPNCRLHVAHPDRSGSLLCPVAVPAGAAVLYPHPHAQDLGEVPASERPPALVVLDGTWAHARRLYRHNPWLSALRHVRLCPAQPSRYRIRREPRPECVSTVEAVVAALQILEPDTRGLEPLLAAFEQMIDRQIAQLDRVECHGRSKAARARPSRRLPPELAAKNVIVVYAETSRPGGDPAAGREIVQWTAARLRTGEALDLLVRPAGDPPPADHLRHMGLTETALAGGLSPGEARARFREFAGDAPVIAVWTRTTLDWGQAMLAPQWPRIVLKRAYCNLRNSAAGFLESVLAREGLTAAAAPCAGRAGPRLGNALVAARWLAAQLAGDRPGRGAASRTAP
jgi:hypothetical protein